jgi:2,5-diketo-D-gluconate reductase A
MALNLQQNLRAYRNRQVSMNIASTVTLHSGNGMPVLGLGTWQLVDDTAGTVERALELGYPMIDTSGDYGTQVGIGEAIRRSGVSRESFYLVTKVEETDNAYQATHNNLRELQLDHADLMLIHRPPDDGVGEVLWEGLLQAKREGLVKDIGVSNYSIDQIRELTETTGEAPVVNQIEWSPFGCDSRMRDYCRDQRIVIQAYSPLTRGQRLDDEVLVKLSRRHGRSPAQLLLRWNLQIGTVPIPKANKLPHLEENLDVFDFELSEGDMAALSSLNEHYSALGSLPYVKNASVPEHRRL